MTKAVECRVTGRVQGVWFRGWTRERALAIGISGWVRNDPDGSVRVLLSGPADAVDRLIEKLKTGPPAARVDGVACETAAPPDAGDFQILR